jgi:NADP-dependent 3-hydroxy acid dehydrogenase YdfG
VVTIAGAHPLDGARALVTGASSGIGAAIARALAAEGARVALLARRRDRLDVLAEELDGTAVAADVTDRGAAQAAVTEAVEALGGLNILVNSAGVALPGLIADGDPDDWRRMLEVNVLGLLHVTQAAIPALRDARGTIVNLSSMSGRRVPTATGGVYAATKFAVHALGEALRQELGQDGVRVTTIAPGFVRSELFDALPDSPTAERYRDLQERLGMEADDVARAVVHVLSQPPGVETVELALVPGAQGSGGY